MIMLRAFSGSIAGAMAAALIAVPSSYGAEPNAVKVMNGLEFIVDSMGAIDDGVRLIVAARFRNTGEGYFAVALVPPFPKVSESDGTTYFMQDVGGVTRCRNNNPIMGPACSGKPATPGITIPPDAYTVLDPGATAHLDFHMTVERGNHRGTYGTFSAVFAVRTFATEAEDRDRTDDEKQKRTRTLNVGAPEIRIVQPPK
jgi:hypothetical protein